MLTPGFYFEADLTAGVRGAALLGQQSDDRQRTISEEVERSVEVYANENRYAIPMAAYVVTVGKDWIVSP